MIFDMFYCTLAAMDSEWYVILNPFFNRCYSEEDNKGTSSKITLALL
jgi:hypothetical protein